jgi:hypothetical protein
MDTFTERALIEAKRRMLVGGELASSTREIFIEETFPKAFEAHIPSILFWRAFEKACGSIVPNEQEDPVLRPQPLLKERKGSMTLESLRRKKGIDLTSEMKIKKQGTSQEWTDARETMLSYTLTCNLNGKDEKVVSGGMDYLS